MGNYEEKLREIINNNSEYYPSEDKAVFAKYFPELKETEDERIRKGLIKAVSGILKGNTLYGTDVTREEAITWLEMQDKKKSADKFKPKFNIEDWVVLTAGELSTTLQIVNVDTNKKLYWFNDDSYLPIVDEECLHLWTIQDAKDGDVLVDVYGNIGIFDKRYDFDWMSYCSLGNNGGFQYFTVEHENEKTYPATKEQRDLLSQKMKEEDYEWDADKKELKKIEVKKPMKGGEHDTEE